MTLSTSSDRIGRSGAGVGYTPSAFHWQPGVVHSVSIWSTERRRAPCTGTPSPWDARAAGLAMGSCRPLWRFPRPAKRDFVPQKRVASVVTRDSSRGTAPGTRAGCRRPGMRGESRVTAPVAPFPTVCNGCDDRCRRERSSILKTAGRRLRSIAWFVDALHGRHENQLPIFVD